MSQCKIDPENPLGCCLTCREVVNAKAGRFPCLRYKITDVRLYKPGNVPGYEWTRRWTNNFSDPIENWASNETKVIRIGDGFSNRSVAVRVRKFVPQAGDKLDRSWDYKGIKKSVSIPPYAIVDLEEAKKAYERHISASMAEAFKSLVPGGLLYKTYIQALQIYQDPSTHPDVRELLGKTLKLWVSIRLSTRSGFIVGQETLGMSHDILDETSPSHGKIPLPPVLGAQVDLILIQHIQTHLRKEVLDRLQKMIVDKNKLNVWYVTYLVTAILLHNTALITAHDAGYARKHGMKVSSLTAGPPPPHEAVVEPNGSLQRRFAREEKVKEYHLGETRPF